MDLKRTLDKASPILKKNRALLIILLVGIILLSLPLKRSQDQKIVSPAQEAKADTETRLSKVLSLIDGAGEVDVLLTEEAGERTYYQTDTTGQNDKQDTVIVTDADRSQSGLIQQIRSPEYRGAVVVCQGADDPVIRLAIVEAVSRVTGLGADRISVLKMK